MFKELRVNGVWLGINSLIFEQTSIPTFQVVAHKIRYLALAYRFRSHERKKGIQRK